MRERRFISGVEIRADSKAGKIEGHAAVFNSLSEDLGGFRERIRPGAFSRSLNSGADVFCLFNHSVDQVLGRRKSGTLRLYEDVLGLEFSCDVPDSPIGRNVYVSVERGDISGCSFSFAALRDDWNKDCTERELIDLDLFDVGPVTQPAYLATSVDARTLWPDGVPVEVRSHRKTDRIVGGYAMPRGPVDAVLETERRRARARLAGFE